MSTFLFNFRSFIDISNIEIMKVNLWKEIKNKLFIGIKNNVETNKLVTDNKEIHVKVKFLLSKLHKCKEDKKALTTTQALDLFMKMHTVILSTNLLHC